MNFLFTMSNSAQTSDHCDRPLAKLASFGRERIPGSTQWWSQTGSNRRPHACKARALPTELWPRPEPPTPKEMVGLGRLELPTSRLSSARSNQLSYKPEAGAGSAGPRARPFRPRTRLVREERETKTTVSRQWAEALCVLKSSDKPCRAGPEGTSLERR